LPLVTLDELVEAGTHFGHRVSRWNPEMKPYIFGKRNQIHIIDLRESVRGLVTAFKLVEKITASGTDALFVGTKRQARQVVAREAMRSGMSYVSERWLGGTLTNFTTVLSSLRRLHELEGLEASGEINALSKKEQASMRRELRKVLRNLGGVRNMAKLPGVLIVVDPAREATAIHEAVKLGIPTVALADTDCNPAEVDIIVPGNDDSIRTIEIFVSRMADACLSGKSRRVILESPKEGGRQPEVEYVRVSAPLDQREG